MRLSVQVFRVEITTGTRELQQGLFLEIRTGRDYAWNPSVQSRLVGIQKTGAGARFADFAGETLHIAVKDPMRDKVHIHVHEKGMLPHLFTTDMLGVAVHPLDNLPNGIPVSVNLPFKVGVIQAIFTAAGFGVPSVGQSLTIVQQHQVATLYPPILQPIQQQTLVPGPMQMQIPMQMQMPSPMSEPRSEVEPQPSPPVGELQPVYHPYSAPAEAHYAVPYAPVGNYAQNNNGQKMV